MDWANFAFHKRKSPDQSTYNVLHSLPPPAYQDHMAP